MKNVKYEVSIPVASEQSAIRAILKKYGIRFDYDEEFNEHGVRGKELVGAWINCSTFITKAVDELCRVSEDIFIHAYKAERSFYKLRLKAKKRTAVNEYRRNDSSLMIPF